MTTWAGIDLAKGTRGICARDAGGRVLLGHAARDTQAGLDLPSAEPRARPGPVTVGLNEDGSIAAFPQAVPLADGPALVHVPRPAVTRAAHGCAGGERQPHPQGARVIAGLVRTREGFRPIRPDEDAATELAPVLRRSSHPRTLRRARRGGRDLERTLYPSAFCRSSSRPGSRACHRRQRREGKHRAQASSPPHASQPTNGLGARIVTDNACNPNHRAA